MRLGMGFDWATEVTTCLPDYYRWNQWFFLRMYERGLAYRKNSKVNWCPECQTVLANEQVINGYCWRHEDTLVEQRELEQWFLRTTQYAQELLDGLDKLDGWPERVRTMQRNWIGRSEGATVAFAIEGRSDVVKVFTTRIDTIYGATSLQLAPEHPLIRALAEGDPELAKRCFGIALRAGPCTRDRRRRRYRKTWCIHRALLHQSVYARARAGVGGELRAARLRNGRDHVRTGA